MKFIFKIIHRISAVIKRYITDPALDFVGGSVFSLLLGRTFLYTSLAFGYLSLHMVSPALMLILLMGLDIMTHTHVLTSLRRLMLFDLANYSSQDYSEHAV